MSVTAMAHRVSESVLRAVQVSGIVVWSFVRMGDEWTINYAGFA